MELSIQERLKDLRVERGLTLEQLAEQTHLSKSALGSYEADDFKDISHYALVRLAKFYGVTTDYLLGLSDYCRDNVSYNPVPQFGQRFRYVLKFCGVTQYRIEKELHLSGSMVYKWLNDISLPSVSSLIRVASYLDVTVDFLIGRTD